MDVSFKFWSSSSVRRNFLATSSPPTPISWRPRPHRYGSLRRATSLSTLLSDDIRAATDDAGILRAFRRFRRRQVLRIGINDIIRDRPLEEITGDLSRVADAALDVAWDLAPARPRRNASASRAPRRAQPAAAVLAFGKLGGEELNYSSDIDLMFVYDDEGQTAGRRPVGNDEFFARVASEVVRLLSAHTDRGQAYRVDLRLRPEGQRGPLARSLASTLSYYDTLGRTWERQALIKVRPVAGDARPRGRVPRGRRAVRLQAVPVVRRDQRDQGAEAADRAAAPSAGGAREVKTGHGGIRDIEFTIQFLQLLNGGDLPAVRQRNTLGALQALEAAGCLTDPEYRVLDDAYRFLRKTEHRLQLLFDLQTHRLPDRPDELRKLALRMGFSQCGIRSAECGIKTCPGFRTPHSAFRIVPSAIRLWTSRPSPRRSTPATCSSIRSTGSCTTTTTRRGSTGRSSTTCCTRRSPTRPAGPSRRPT